MVTIAEGLERTRHTVRLEALGLLGKMTNPVPNVVSHVVRYAVLSAKTDAEDLARRIRSACDPNVVSRESAATAASVFASDRAGTITCERLGPLPPLKEALFLVLHLHPKCTYVLELRNWRTLASYTQNQVRDAIKKMNSSRRRCSHNASAKRIAVAVGTHALGLSNLSQRRFWNTINFSNFVTALTKKRPRSKKTSVPQPCDVAPPGESELLRLLGVMEHKRRLMTSMPGGKKMSVATIADEACLRDILFRLYCVGWSPSPEASALLAPFGVIHNDAIERYVNTPASAVGRRRTHAPAPPPAQAPAPEHGPDKKVHLRMLTVLKGINAVASVMRSAPPDAVSALDMIVRLACAENSLFSRALGSTCRVTPDEIMRTLGYGSTGREALGGNRTYEAIIKLLDGTTKALQLVLLTCQDESSHHRVVGGDGWLRQVVGPLLNRKTCSGPRKHSREARQTFIVFRKLCPAKTFEAWVRFQKGMCDLLEARAPRTPVGTQSRLREMLKPHGGISKANRNNFETNVSGWCRPEKRRAMVRDLRWLFLFAAELVEGFDGSPAAFVDLYLGSALGGDLLRASVGWFATVSEMLRARVVSDPGFKAPPFCEVRETRLKCQADRHCYGAPLELAVDLAWAVHLDTWPEVPREGLSNPEDPEVLYCARHAQFVALWAFSLDWNNRPHLCEEVCLVTEEEWRALDPSLWGNREMQHGLWFVCTRSDTTGDLVRLRVIINDSKVVVARSDRSRDSLRHGKYVYEKVLFEAGSFAPGYAWLEALFPRFEWAYRVLSPRGRSYTSTIRDHGSGHPTGSFRRVPVHIWPTPKTVVRSDAMMCLDARFDAHADLAEALAAAAAVSRAVRDRFRATRRKLRPGDRAGRRRLNGEIARALAAEGVAHCPYPPRPSRNHHVGSSAQANTHTQYWLSEAMSELVAAANRGVVRLEAHRWRPSNDPHEPRWSSSKAKSASKSAPEDRDLRVDLERLVGRPRLFGDEKFTEEDASSLRVLSDAARDGTVVFLLCAPRHTDLAVLAGARTMMVGRMPADHPLVAALDNEMREKERQGAHESRHVLETFYCDKNRDYELCNPRLTQHTHDRLRGHPVSPRFDLARGKITAWPTSLVAPADPATFDATEDVWLRARDFRRLTISEQMKSLYHFECVHSMVRFLAGQHAHFRHRPELREFWEWVESFRREEKRGKKRKNCDSKRKNASGGNINGRTIRRREISV